MMKTGAIKMVGHIAMLGVFLFSSLPVLADQTDPRLDHLFNELRISPDYRRVQFYSGEIWRLWYEYDDEKVKQIFETGRMAMYEQDFDTAYKHLNEAIRLAPDFAEAWNTRAIAYFLQEDYEKSLQDIEQTLKLEPRHFGALVGKGQCYYELQKLAPALNAFEKALEIHPWLYDAREKVKFLRNILDNQA